MTGNMELSQKNSKEYWDTKYQGHLDRDEIKHWDRTHTWEILDNIIRTLPYSGFFGHKLLDLGCGPGDFLIYLWDRQCKYVNWQISHSPYELFQIHTYYNKCVGVDRSQVAIDYAKQRYTEHREATKLDFKVGEAYPVEAEDGSFSIITMNEIFEHIPDLQALLQECNRLLEKGGSLLITTPLNGCLGDEVEHEHIFNYDDLYRIIMDTDFFQSITFYPEIRWFPEDPNLVSICAVARKVL